MFFCSKVIQIQPNQNTCAGLENEDQQAHWETNKQTNKLGLHLVNPNSSMSSPPIIDAPI